MPKEVILISPVEGLGDEGEVLRVADGYARNYLLPRKLALPVSAATRKLVEKKRIERLAREAEQLDKASELAGKLANVSITIPVKTGENGKLFGSVNAADILAQLEKQGIKLDKKQLTLAAPLRELGVFNVPLKLHAEVDATLKVWVVEE
jgi:large subunit ribosomal protein L9